MTCQTCYRLSTNVKRARNDLLGAVRLVERFPESSRNRTTLVRRQRDHDSARETIVQHELTCYPAELAVAA